MTNGILIASPNSGSGKTIITLGLLKALSRYTKVRGAKSGPDFIDPRFHEIASGNKSFNLDTWAMNHQRIKNLSIGEGHLIVEGAMGLFDGDTSGKSGSAASLAKLLDLQVILVVDCSKIAQSVTALGGNTLIYPILDISGSNQVSLYCMFVHRRRCHAVANEIKKKNCADLTCRLPVLIPPRNLYGPLSRKEHNYFLFEPLGPCGS